MIKITHIPDPARSDGGGDMEVKAVSPKDKLEVFEHFKLTDLRELTSRAPLRVLQTAGTKDDAGWFEVFDSVPDAFIRPYLKLLGERTGYAGALPDMEERELIKGHGVLRFTHYTRRLFTDNGRLNYVFVVKSRDWDGGRASQRAIFWARESMLGSLGTTKIESEYVSVGGGLFARNPNYLKHHDPVPGLAAQWLLGPLVDWWVRNCATAAQAKLVNRSAVIMRQNHNGVSDLHCLRDRTGLTHEWSKPAVKWEEFKNLT